MPGEAEFSLPELMRTLNRIESSTRESLLRIESRLDKSLTLEVFNLYQETTRRELTEIHQDLADMQANSAKRAAELEAGSKERNVQVNTRIGSLESKHDMDVEAIRTRLDEAEKVNANRKDATAKMWITWGLGIAAAIFIPIILKGIGL
jgi:transcriptional regulator of heat shock response